MYRSSFGRSRRQKPDVDEDREIVMFVMAEMRKLGYVAKANFSCCGGCAGYEIAAKLGEYVEKKVKKLPLGCVFWTRQDEQNFRDTGHLWIAFGSISHGESVPIVNELVPELVDAGTEWKTVYRTPVPTVYVGRLMERLLKEKGVKVEWNGDPNERLMVSVN